MTKADIVEKIHATTGLSKKDSSVMMESVFAIMKESLEAGETIKISGFGVFEPKQKTHAVAAIPRLVKRSPLRPARC